MNRHVNAIAGRLSLRPPQRRSLEILDRISEIVPPKKSVELDAALAAIGSEFPTVTNFEREFPSLCFALATGVGKTRLMGAFIAYLHLAHGLNNFFVLAPNLTIYNKLITDFTQNTPKYVLKGISEFAVAPPVITTGENYERQIASGGQTYSRRRSTSSTFRRSIPRCVAGVRPDSQLPGGNRRELFRLSRRSRDLVLIMDEFASLSRICGHSRHQRAKASYRPRTDRDTLCGDDSGTDAFQERHLRLSARQGDGRWVREGAGRRYAQELQSGRHVG